MAREDHLCPRSIHVLGVAQDPLTLVQSLMEGGLHPWEVQASALPSALEESVFGFGSRSRKSKQAVPAAVTWRLYGVLPPFTDS